MKKPDPNNMQRPSCPHLAAAQQFPMAARRGSTPAISHNSGGETVRFANGSVSIPTPPCFRGLFHHFGHVTLPGVPKNRGRTGDPQHYSNPTYMAGISAISDHMHVHQTAGMIHNGEERTCRLAFEPPPSYTDLFGPKRNTAEAGTSMDPTIPVPRSLIIPRNASVPREPPIPGAWNCIAGHPISSANPTANGQSSAQIDVLSRNRAARYKWAAVILKLVIIIVLFSMVYVVTKLIMCIREFRYSAINYKFEKNCYAYVHCIFNRDH